MLALFREHGIKFLFMIPRLAVRKLLPTIHNGGLVKVTKNGFWSPRAPSGKSLRKAARLFNEIKGKVIIEIGSGIQGHFSGNSVLIWAKKTNAERIICLDLNPKEIKLVKDATTKFPQVEALVQDGIEYVDNFDGKIDLLYLDFWTDDPEGELPGTGRAQAYLDAYKAARKKLSETSLILIDDTDHIHPWKHTEIIPAARKDGFRVLHVGRQTLMARSLEKK